MEWLVEEVCLAHRVECRLRGIAARVVTRGRVHSKLGRSG